ncbi:MAG: hypothetical protein GPI94_14200 [Microcystis aeruginosa LG13-03]|nr:hypothetical protein [Microcystis aeruginosa LG13-13]NCR05040.1 hypothetical protein [Microcystis aeruginosa LG13-03]NCR63273.1 hypothetical protein [Microcystis aeruginosa LG11-05]
MVQFGRCFLPELIEWQTITPLEYPLADALKATGLSYSLCDKFNLYSSDRSLCLCGSFPSLFIAGSLH